MKKFFPIVLTIAMLLTAVAAFADGGPQMGGPQDGPQGGLQMGQMQGAPQLGNDNDRQTPPEKPSVDQGTAPEKPDAAPEKPSGEKPADAPAEPEDLTGDKPADIPEKPTDGQQATADDQRPTEGQQAPQGQEGQGPKMDDKAPSGFSISQAGFLYCIQELLRCDRGHQRLLC